MGLTLMLSQPLEARKLASLTVRGRHVRPRGKLARGIMGMMRDHGGWGLTQKHTSDVINFMRLLDMRAHCPRQETFCASKRSFLVKHKTVSVDGTYKVELNTMMKPKMVPMVHRNMLYKMDLKMCDSTS